MGARKVKREKAVRAALERHHLPYQGTWCTAPATTPNTSSPPGTPKAATPQCRLQKPNLEHHASGLKITWHKWPLRGGQADKPITLDERKAIIQDCIAASHPPNPPPERTAPRMSLTALFGRVAKRDPFKHHEERLAVLATNHATERDAKLLERCTQFRGRAPLPLIVYPHDEYGWLVNTAPTALDPEELEREGFSQALQRLLSDARDAGYSWLLLDRDADPHPDYPTHDW